MTQEDILEMARSSGVADGIELQHEIDAVMRFAELVAAAERKALANKFIETLTKTLESLAATAPQMPMAIKNLNAIAVAAEREACAKMCEDAISSIWEFNPEYVNTVCQNTCRNLAAAIRARGNECGRGELRK